ncbi:MAG TPA: DUF1569 domain-containing protein [Gemmatimonadetes bacterium]|nr:DUF1569 domain-containing protein [Gemmatimonadota bacterium]
MPHCWRVWTSRSNRHRIRPSTRRLRRVCPAGASRTTSSISRSRMGGSSAGSNGPATRIRNSRQAAVALAVAVLGAAWIVLLAGAFPRGRGKAPERTLPTGADAVELADSLRDTRSRVVGLEGSLAQLEASNATRNHFAFGDLNAAQWLKFTGIHARHHQKIIRDVLRAGSV